MHSEHTSRPWSIREAPESESEKEARKQNTERTLSDSEALDTIAQVLNSSADWNADTIDSVSRLVWNTGRKYRDTNAEPKIDAQEVKAQLVSIRDSLGEDYEGGGLPVRLQVQEDGSWEIHTGDSSYDLDHRGYWGSDGIQPDFTEKDLQSIAEGMIEQALDTWAEANT